MSERFIAVGLLVALLVSSCKKQEESPVPETTGDVPPLTEVPKGFPPIDYPEDNAFSMERWKLGKRLFFDPALSEDGSVSCASCHAPEHAFADLNRVSTGVHGLPGTRNSPSLANVAYQPYFTREGGVPTLEMQVLVPIQEHNEFGSNIITIAERMMEDETYIAMSQEAYERDPDPFVITRAIAAFERTLLSGNSAYDRFEFGGDRTALSGEAQRGMALFFSDRTDCGTCHSGFNFTDYGLENNGLYEAYDDPGRFRVTNDSADLGRFKVPSLRNAALTPPYMHDGSLETLEDVIDHYNSGGADHPNKHPLIRPLALSQQEVTDLVSFLESLSDPTFLTNPNLRHE